MSRTSTVGWLTAFLGVGLLAGISAYQFGLEKGRKEGETVQEQRSKLAHAQNAVVYLALAAKKEKAGETAHADKTRNLLLYGSAMDMQDAIDSGKLSAAELGKWPPEPVLSEVAKYFHQHPESVAPIEEDPSTKHLVPDLRKLMDRYDPGTHAPAGP